MPNKLTEILKIEHPIILGPMRRITLGLLAAEVSACGGLGQIASSGLSLEQLREEIAHAQKITDKPIGVNIPLHRPYVLEILQIAAEMGVRIITTSGGNPSVIMGPAREAKVIVLHKVSTVEMGLKAQRAGVEGVIGMGFEAGGHTGKSQVTTLCLIPQLVDALDIPVIAAGGIGDYRGYLAALALGASGVEIGTRFLASAECGVSSYYKEALVQAKETSTVVVGDEPMMLRILKNKAAEFLLERNRDKSTQPRIVDYSSAEGNIDNTIMPAGQGAGLVSKVMPVGDILTEFVEKSRELAADINLFLKK